MLTVIFLFQAEDGIRDLVRSRGLGDVYKRQVKDILPVAIHAHSRAAEDASRRSRAGEGGEIGELSLIHI